MSRAHIHGVLFVVPSLFSLNYIISKVAMRELPPLAFAWLRVAGSAGAERPWSTIFA